MPISRSAAKRRVDKATRSLTGTRCLIENTEEHNQVQYVHCLPPSTHPSVLEFLEYHWNLERGTLNVDSRQNTIRLGPKFQYLFENKLFFLLPEHHIIDLYYEAATARLPPAQRRASFPKLQEPTYKYRLIAHPYMKRVPIHRQRDSVETDSTALKATDFTFYSYPYENFPVIVSHVHPRYVIYNAGQKISRNCRTYLEEYPSLALDILGVKDTYEAWSSAPKYNDPFFETTVAAQDVDVESDSNATRKRRSRGKAQKQNIQTAGRQSKRMKEQRAIKGPLHALQLELSEVKSPYTSRQEERIGSPSENWLDEQTLRELDENRTVEKNWDMRMAKISRWVDDVMSHCQAFQVLQLPENGVQPGAHA